MLVVSPDQLMQWERQKFDLLKEKGVWNAPSEEEEKLIALRAMGGEHTRDLLMNLSKPIRYHPTRPS